MSNGALAVPVPWAAEWEITPQDATRLIESHFPELAPVRLEAFGSGWDNTAFLVSDRWVFRFPRRPRAAPFLHREAQILPRLASYLPAPIPLPCFVAEPKEGEPYPYPFTGYEKLSGRTACSVAGTDEERAANAHTIARFLAALHRIPIDDATRQQAPGDEIGRADLAKRVPMTRERLANIAPILDGAQVAALQELIERLADTPAHDGPTCWVHGDLYPRHLLVDDNYCFCGVIDWGDVHLGDPALDLSIAWSFLPPSSRNDFRRAYGPITEATWDRARFRALFYGVVLTEYGASVGDTAIRSAGEYALHAVLQETKE